MEDVDKYLSSRRDLIKIGATAAVAGLAGCSGDNDGNNKENSDPTDSETPTDEPDTEVDDPTATEEPETQDSDTSNQNSGASSLIEENEPQIEEDYEAEIDRSLPNEGWIEIENPEEQIPRENYNLEDYPHLQLLEDEENNFNAYDPENEAVYLIWLELADQDGIGLTAFQIKDYEKEEYTQSLASSQYTDQGLDIEGILGEVVEGVNDVPEDLDEQYADLLT